MTDSNPQLGSFFTSVMHSSEDSPNEIPSHLLTILEKKPSERSPLEITTLKKYLRGRDIFAQIASSLSDLVVREWVKKTELRLLADGEFLAVAGQRVRSVDVLLFG